MAYCCTVVDFAAVRSLSLLVGAVVVGTIVVVLLVGVRTCGSVATVRSLSASMVAVCVGVVVQYVTR